MKSSFLIIGDSWGVGEWERPNRVFSPIPNTGIDYYLRSLGHTVTNISAGKAGNFSQLRHGHRTLKNESNYDYIIWFHTEPIRDIEEVIVNNPPEGQKYYPEFSMENFNDSIRYINQENYRYAQNISNEYNIPFIVIGGQGSVDSIIQEFTFAQHVIPSWLQELLNLDFTPSTTLLFSWQRFKYVLTHYEIKERYFILENEQALDQANIIMDLCTASDLFPDNIHPSRKCFEQLAHRILEMVNHDRKS